MCTNNVQEIPESSNCVCVSTPKLKLDPWESCTEKESQDFWGEDEKNKEASSEITDNLQECVEKTQEYESKTFESVSEKYKLHLFSYCSLDFVQNLNI